MAIRHFRNSVLAVAVLAAITLIVIAQALVRVVYQSHQQQVANHLQTTLNTTSELISTWYQRRVGAMQVLLVSEQSRKILADVVDAGANNDETIARLESQIVPLLAPMGYEGYSILGTDQRTIAATSKESIGVFVVHDEARETMNRALLFGPSISRPFPAVFTLESINRELPAGTLYQILCGAIFYRDKHKGFLCLRINPETNFFPIFFSGRTGTSGEVYAIDNNGMLVTPSRFITAEHNASRPDWRANEMPKIDAKVPTAASGSLQSPFTELAGKLIAHKSTITLVGRPGYPDYRGIPVVGTGNWRGDMGIGIIVEQDYDEAFGSYTLARNIIWSLASSAIGLIVLLSLNYLVNRRSLAIRESRFRSLVENIPTPIYMKDLDGRFTVVNSDFCRMVTLHRDDILGSTSEELPLPAWLQQVLCNDTDFNSDYSVTDQHVNLPISAEAPSHFRMLRFPIVGDERRGPGGIATVLVDTTARVVASKRLKEINQNLENLVDQRTMELVEAKEAAEAASKVKAEFLASMSHEIRTPLNAIIGLANVGLKKKIDDILRDYLQKIRGSAQHLLQVMNDILDFSRLEAGKYYLNVSEFQLQDVIDKAVDLVWAKAEAKGLPINIEIDDSIPFILVGDPLRLGQILINFASNAVKFTDSGYICIRSKKRFQDANQVGLEFEVEDTGIGINAATLKGLFQPFQQADSGSSRAYEGSGLGLVICKNLANLMNGRIEVDSTPGKGSRFRLLVSLNYRVDPATLPGANVNEPEFIPSEQIDATVLVVEDNPLNQEVAEALLREFGAEVSIASSGPEAIEIFAANDFDIVLMDIRMPGMDGIQVTNALRNTAKGATVPIIAMTANTQAGDREHYLSAGMDDYVEKPIDPKQLFTALQHWTTFPRNNSSSNNSPRNNNSRNNGSRNNGAAQSRAAQSQPGLITKDRFSLLQHQGVDTESALRQLLYNRALYHRLLSKFADSYSEVTEQLCDSTATEHRDSLLAMVHTLGSQAGTLGFCALRNCARQVEANLKNGRDDSHQLHELRQQLEIILTVLQNYRTAAGENFDTELFNTE